MAIFMLQCVVDVLRTVKSKHTTVVKVFSLLQNSEVSSFLKASHVYSVALQRINGALSLFIIRFYITEIFPTLLSISPKSIKPPNKRIAYPARQVLLRL